MFFCTDGTTHQLYCLFPYPSFQLFEQHLELLLEVLNIFVVAVRL